VEIIEEIFTGRMRPRHQRFVDIFKVAAARKGYEANVVMPNLARRISINTRALIGGIRSFLGGNQRGPALLHQALFENTKFPYAAEFDVPLAIFGYSQARRDRFSSRAKDCLQNPNLKKIVVFSEWARRSFELYFGSEIGKKLHVVYPAVGWNLEPISSETPRKYDFIFVSTQFRIKSGVQVLNAFKQLRAKLGHPLRLCLISNLKEVHRCVGPFENFEGVDFIEANISDAAVRSLLCSSKILVHPSLMESFGVVVLEALNCGCGIVSTNIASFPEMVIDGLNGLKLEPPISAVVGDYFVPELSSAQGFSNLLSSFCLDEWTWNIGVAMESVLTSFDKQNYGLASKKLFSDRFSDEKLIDSLDGVLLALKDGHL
jgi:glycosyltransferase involved in cell wall biosynthesis